MKPSSMVIVALSSLKYDTSDLQLSISPTTIDNYHAKLC